MNLATNAPILGERSNGHQGLPDAVSLPRLVMPILTEEMLARFASRAAAYDRENRFIDEDFEELRASKYLLFASNCVSSG